MYEPRHHPLLPRQAYFRRVAGSLLLGLGLIAASLVIGMAGYHYFEGISWIDAYVNAAMLLSGMGPLVALQTDGGKIFAGLYAIYSGFAVLIIAAITFAPIFHRFLHRFHLESRER